MRLNLEGSRELAEHAVKDVYQFGSSYDRKKVGSYLQFMLRPRGAIAAKFRAEHGCSVVKNSTEQANTFPYFIGVFDAVATLGIKWLAPVLIAAVLAILVGLHLLDAWMPRIRWDRDRSEALADRAPLRSGQPSRDRLCLPIRRSRADCRAIHFGIAFREWAIPFCRRPTTTPRSSKRSACREVLSGRQCPPQAGRA